MALYNNWIPDKNDKLYKILFPKGEKSINEYKNCYPLQTIINHYNFNNPISIEENQDKDLLFPANLLLLTYRNYKKIWFFGLFCLIMTLSIILLM